MLVIHFFEKRKKSYKQMLLPIEMFFFMIGYALNFNKTISEYVSPENALAYLFFLFIIVAYSSIIQSSNRTGMVILMLITAGSVSLIIAYKTYPIFKQIENWDLIFIFRLPRNISIPFFYLVIPLLSITSFLFSYSWINYLDFTVAEFFGMKKLSMPPINSVLVHIQIVPQVLSPLLFAQLFGITEYFESIALVLYTICVSQTVLFLYCPIIAFLGKKILELKFMWITSIFSLASFISSVNVAFQFIAL